MKMLFSSPDRTAVGLLQSGLEEAGIECELRNDAMQAQELHFIQSCGLLRMRITPELWSYVRPSAAEPPPLRRRGPVRPVASSWRGSSYRAGSVEQIEMLTHKFAPANGGGPSRLQSVRLVAAVAIGSLGA
jgi:hypothetical protein